MLAELLVSANDGWFDALKQAFRDGNNNLTQWQVHDRFLGWLDDDRSGGLPALRALWVGDNPPIERLESFLERVPTTGLGPLGERLNIGTYLLMAEDPISLPPMKIRPFRRAWKLTKWGRDADGLRPADVYERGLVFLDELVRDSAMWQVPLRDRLDAQGAVWSLVKYTKNPYHWPDDDWQEFVNVAWFGTT